MSVVRTDRIPRMGCRDFIFPLSGGLIIGALNGTLVQQANTISKTNSVGLIILSFLTITISVLLNSIIGKHFLNRYHVDGSFSGGVIGGAVCIVVVICVGMEKASSVLDYPLKLTLSMFVGVIASVVPWLIRGRIVERKHDEAGASV